MTNRSDRGSGSPGIASFFGGLVAFVVFVELVRLVRAPLLVSPEPSWAIPRLILWLFVGAGCAGAGAAAAALFFLWSRTRGSTSPLAPLPFGRGPLLAIAAAALGFGVLARLAWLDTIPATIWFDEVLPLEPSMSLQGRWSDFADAIRIIPLRGRPIVFSGVVFLEGYRLILHTIGTSVFAMRLPAALAGSVSLVTAFLLGRSLLPRGGATIAVLALAGLRWQLIVSRYGWNVISLAPLTDVALLLALRARRRQGLGAALAAGLVAGLGAHVYLAAWIAAAGLGLFLLWPQPGRTALRHRAALAVVFGAGFLAAVSPIYILKKDRRASYFSRASEQSLMLDFRRTKNWGEPFEIIADSIRAPWFLPDPLRRQDLPRSRLGWILGIPVAAAFARALRSPREDLSAILFAYAAAAVAGTMRWGAPGHPNGYRFAYLTGVTVLAVASGVLWLVGLARRRRRLAALGALGLLGFSTVSGARDALLRWGESRVTFESYWSDSTLIGRAALRWGEYGSVRVVPGPGVIGIVVDAIRDYGLDPAWERSRASLPRLAAAQSTGRRCFRVAKAAAALQENERVVEVLQDGWGAGHGVVLGGRCGTSIKP